MINFYGRKDLIKGRIRNIKKMVLKIAADHNKTIHSIDYILIDDEALLEINRSALNHDYYTDIITFDYSQHNMLEGEIYISYDRVKENAEKFNDPFHVELLRVVFHGVLHMVGYKDKTRIQKTKMRESENHYLNLYAKL